MKTITVRGGKETIVDDDAEFMLRGYDWHYDEATGFVRARSGTGPGYYIYLHRFLVGATGHDIVLHRNLDPLDNRRSNLIFADAAAARATSPKRKGLLSRYKGVRPFRGQWYADISIGNKKHYLGVYASEEDAARAYNRAARALPGRDLRINEVPDDSER
jgi:hypothetical protein